MLPTQTVVPKALHQPRDGIGPAWVLSRDLIVVVFISVRCVDLKSQREWQGQIRCGLIELDGSLDR